ncbi:hypothetical protein NKH77_08920 [Streptomyces sp. M19]
MTSTGPSRDGSTSAKREVLICGASIAGPALAYWLHRSGFAVTVVEKASARAAVATDRHPRHRDRGGPADGDTAAAAGRAHRLAPLHLPRRRRRESGLGQPQRRRRQRRGQDLEVRRGDLAALLHASVRDDVEFLFDNSVDTLDQTEHGVDVTFHRGQRRTFDLVVGADGMHSATRKSLFGPEEQFHRYLGYCFAIFTMPNTFGLSRELVMWNTREGRCPLRRRGRRGVARLPELPPTGTAARRAPEPRRPTGPGRRDVRGRGMEVPGLVDAMRDADDLFFDTAGQIRMPRWSRAASRSSATPRTRPRSSPDKARAWRWSVPTCSPTPRHEPGPHRRPRRLRARRARVRRHEPGAGRQRCGHALPHHGAGPGATRHHVARPRHPARRTGATGPLGPDAAGVRADAVIGRGSRSA